ncbi:peptide deformylase [Vibrio nomapromontoriensis]|uniref:peptide deformylase n=1 Tax=Vibrio nomapromontoriensis TaxID=2910246 RepID=UPI003D131DFD
MSVLEILTIPDLKLRKIAHTVKEEEFNSNLSEFVDDMLETMYESGGVGLAATQVGVSKRVVVIDISHQRDSPMILVNPQYSSIDDSQQLSQEGCLSVLEFSARVNRLNKIRVSASDEKGKPLSFTAEGLLSVCIQHECDHLNGTLFIDYLDRDRIQSVLNAMRGLA